VAFAVAAAVAFTVPSASAQAQDHSAQVSFLARMMIDVTVGQLSIEHDFLIRLPAQPEVAGTDGRRSPVSLGVPGSVDVVALLGPGLDVSSPTESEGDVRLQLKPNFGRRGGLLRCTFRF